MTLVKPHGRYGRTTLRDIDWETGPDRMLCHNTYRSSCVRNRNDDGEIIATAPCVIFHRTTIVTSLGNGQYILNSGGWRTSTTKQRLNALLWNAGINVWQKNFEWFVSDANGTRPFFDQMIVCA